MKAVKVQEEGTVEEALEEEGGQGEDQRKGHTDAAPVAPKEATYRSYTISEIIRITE